MHQIKKRMFVSSMRLFMALFSISVLVFGYYYFASPSAPSKNYDLFGLEIAPITMGYVSIALIVLAAITHTSGQIIFWCKKDRGDGSEGDVTKQLMCGPLYLNAIYLVLLVVIIAV